jgi:hypothetical protein
VEGGGRGEGDGRMEEDMKGRTERDGRMESFF